MRNFAKVSPNFWTGKTGRRINSLDPGIRDSVRIVAAYLVTSPHAHACGLYKLPLIFAAYDTALSVESVRASLVVLEDPEMNFSAYDEGSEFVWVKGMAEFQLNLPIQNNDSYRVGLARWFLTLEENPFLLPFFERYRHELLLPKRVGLLTGGRRGVEGASRGGGRSPSPSPSPSPSLTQSPNSKSPNLISQSQSRSGKGDQGETQRILDESWKQIVTAAEKVFSQQHVQTWIRSNRLIRIDSKTGLYVVACPSVYAQDFLKQNRALLGQVARAQGIKVSQFHFVVVTPKEKEVGAR